MVQTITYRVKLNLFQYCQVRLAFNVEVNNMSMVGIHQVFKCTFFGIKMNVFFASVYDTGYLLVFTKCFCIFFTCAFAQGYFQINRFHL